MDEKKELYYLRKITELERRVAKLEADNIAKRINPNNGSDCYSINELAGILGVNRLTIERRIKNGTIKAVKMGKTWRIPRTVLDQIFE